MTQLYRKSIIVFLSLATLFSCIRVKNNNEIKTILNEKIGQQLDLVDSLKTFSLTSGWGERNKTNWYKIVTYIDGDCGSCIYSLMKWDEFVNENKYSEIEFLFFIRTHDFNQLIAMLNEINFSPSIIPDKNDIFFIKNSLPDDMRFHTFLVNSENKIVLIGNPISDIKIEQLYLEVLHQKLN